MIPIITAGGGEALPCEHFDSYADGHALTYFRGALPAFGGLVGRLSALPAVRSEVARSRAEHGKPAADDFKWRLTLNHYPTGAEQPRRVGFPWHRDLIANGAATMILNLGGPGMLEFGEEPGQEQPADGLLYPSDRAHVGSAPVVPMEEVRLTDGDLLVLTGEARWRYLHRVLPSHIDDASRCERVSLVWGVW